MTTTSYSRSEWASLTIQDRIRAMNETLDLVEDHEKSGEGWAANTTPPSAASPTQRLLSPSGHSKETTSFPFHPDEKEEESATATTKPRRSSVVDIWRQREGSATISTARPPSLHSPAHAVRKNPSRSSLPAPGHTGLRSVESHRRNHSASSAPFFEPDATVPARQRLQVNTSATSAQANSLSSPSAATNHNVIYEEKKEEHEPDEEHQGHRHVASSTSQDAKSHPQFRGAAAPTTTNNVRDLWQQRAASAAGTVATSSWTRAQSPTSLVRSVSPTPSQTPSWTKRRQDNTCETRSGTVDLTIVPSSSDKDLDSLSMTSNGGSLSPSASIKSQRSKKVTEIWARRAASEAEFKEQIEGSPPDDDPSTPRRSIVAIWKDRVDASSQPTAHHHQQPTPTKAPSTAATSGATKKNRRWTEEETTSTARPKTPNIGKIERKKETAKAAEAPSVAGRWPALKSPKAAEDHSLSAVPQKGAKGPTKARVASWIRQEEKETSVSPKGASKVVVQATQGSPPKLELVEKSSPRQGDLSVSNGSPKEPQVLMQVSSNIGTKFPQTSIPSLASKMPAGGEARVRGKVADRWLKKVEEQQNAVVQAEANNDKQHSPQKVLPKMGMAQRYSEETDEKINTEETTELYPTANVNFVEQLDAPKTPKTAVASEETDRTPEPVQITKLHPVATDPVVKSARNSIISPPAASKLKTLRGKLDTLYGNRRDTNGSLRIRPKGDLSRQKSDEPRIFTEELSKPIRASKLQSPIRRAKRTDEAEDKPESPVKEVAGPETPSSVVISSQTSAFDKWERSSPVKAESPEKLDLPTDMPTDPSLKPADSAKSALSEPRKNLMVIGRLHKEKGVALKMAEMAEPEFPEPEGEPTTAPRLGAMSLSTLQWFDSSEAHDMGTHNIDGDDVDDNDDDDDYDENAFSETQGDLMTKFRSKDSLRTGEKSHATLKTNGVSANSQNLEHHTDVDLADYATEEAVEASLSLKSSGSDSNDRSVMSSASYTRREAYRRLIDRKRLLQAQRKQETKDGNGEAAEQNTPDKQDDKAVKLQAVSNRAGPGKSNTIRSKAIRDMEPRNFDPSEANGSADENAPSTVSDKQSFTSSEYTALRLSDSASMLYSQSAFSRPGKLRSSPVSDFRPSEGGFAETQSAFSATSRHSGISLASSLFDRAERALQQRRRRNGPGDDFPYGGTLLARRALEDPFVNPDPRPANIRERVQEPIKPASPQPVIQPPVAESSPPSKTEYKMDSIQSRKRAGLSTRYNTSSRFIDNDISTSQSAQVTASDAASVEPSVSVDESAASSYQTMETATTDSDSRYHTEKSSSGRQGDSPDHTSTSTRRRNRRRSRAPNLVTDKFVSENYANFDAFQNAAKSVSLGQLAADMAGEVSMATPFDLKKIAKNMNETVKSLRSLVGGNEKSPDKMQSPRCENMSLKCANFSPSDEDVAIEVEYLDGSLEEDNPEDDLGVCAPVDGVLLVDDSYTEELTSTLQCNQQYPTGEHSCEESGLRKLGA